MVTVVANSADSHGQSSDQEGADSSTASRVDRWVEVLRHVKIHSCPCSHSHISQQTRQLMSQTLYKCTFQPSLGEE
jgi:surfactin synthase thioesterase subunit